jgi:hypothetical protein
MPAVSGECSHGSGEGTGRAPVPHDARRRLRHFYGQGRRMLTVGRGPPAYRASAASCGFAWSGQRVQRTTRSRSGMQREGRRARAQAAAPRHRRDAARHPAHQSAVRRVSGGRSSAAPICPMATRLRTRPSAVRGPVDRPPCILHRRRGASAPASQTTGATQAWPSRHRAPHRGRSPVGGRSTGRAVARAALCRSRKAAGSASRKRAVRARLARMLAITARCSAMSGRIPPARRVKGVSVDRPGRVCLHIRCKRRCLCYI